MRFQQTVSISTNVRFCHRCVTPGTRVVGCLVNQWLVFSRVFRKNSKAVPGKLLIPVLATTLTLTPRLRYLASSLLLAGVPTNLLYSASSDGEHIISVTWKLAG